MQAGQQTLMESFQRLEALVMGARADSGWPSPGTAGAESGMGAAPRGEQRWRGGDPEISVLLFFPFEVK